LYYEELELFLTDRNEKDFVFLRFGNEIDHYDIEMSIQNLIKSEPSLQTFRPLHRIITLFDGNPCMVIYIPFLISLQHVSYSHILCNTIKPEITVPMYATYFMILYSQAKCTKEEKEEKDLQMINKKSRDVALRSVVKIVLFWIHKSTHSKSHLLEIDDPLFKVYRCFTKIISRWESAEFLINAILFSYKAFQVDKTQLPSLFTGLVAFFHLRRDHRIRKSTLINVLNILKDKEREPIYTKFKDLRTFLQKLYNLYDNNRTIPNITLKLPKKIMNDLWTNIGEQDKYTLPWVELYVLASTDLLTNEEARDIILGLSLHNNISYRPRVVGMVFQNEIKSSFTDFVGDYAKSYKDNFPGKKVGCEIGGVDKPSIVCYFLRMLEFCSMYSYEDRMALIENGYGFLGSCNADPYDLLQSFPILPITIDSNKCPIYSSDSLYLNLFKKDNYFNPNDGMTRIILDHYSYISRNIELGNHKNYDDNPYYDDIMMKRAYRKLGEWYHDNKNRIINTEKNIVNWREVFNKECREYAKQDQEEKRKKKEPRFSLKELMKCLT